MTTRTTSRAAYEHLVATGQLKAKQQRIMDKLIDMGAATSGEVLAALGVQNVNAWRARFTELQGRGLIVEVGTRRCVVSNRTCVVWQASDRRKPMDVKRGTRDGKLQAWQDLAGRMVRGYQGEVVDAAELVASYRKLAGANGKRHVIS